jgi:ribosomal protein S18 acetylase RimI-like enzyme
MTHRPLPRSDGVLLVTITYLEIAPKDWTRRGQPPVIAVEIVFFGLTPEYIGRHIGPWLLDRAIERGFTRGAATLVLNTNTVDHPHALDTYRKAGFRIVRREEAELQDPRVLWPDIYRWPPK